MRTSEDEGQLELPWPETDQLELPFPEGDE